jgi:hypothetical protein
MNRKTKIWNYIYIFLMQFNQPLSFAVISSDFLTESTWSNTRLYAFYTTSISFDLKYKL